MTSKEELIEKFNNEDKDIYIDYLKFTLPTEKDIKTAYTDYEFFVLTTSFKKMDGLYNNDPRADYLIYSVFEPLAQVGLIDLDTMQAKAKQYKNAKQLLLYVKNTVNKSIELVNRYANKLVIEGNNKLIGLPHSPKEDKNNVFSTLLLDDYLSNNNHPNKDIYNRITSFKKQYEQLEKA